jgi:flavodoxin
MGKRKGYTWQSDDRYSELRLLSNEEVSKVLSIVTSTHHRYAQTADAKLKRVKRLLPIIQNYLLHGTTKTVAEKIVRQCNGDLLRRLGLRDIIQKRLSSSLNEEEQVISTTVVPNVDEAPGIYTSNYEELSSDWIHRWKGKILNMIYVVYIYITVLLKMKDGWK